MLNNREKLIQYLVEKKVISVDRVKQLTEEHKKRGGKFSEVLVSLGVLSQKEMDRIVEELAGCRSVDIAKIKIPPELISLIPKKVAKLYKVLPVSKSGDNITVAMINPMDIFAIDDLKAITRCEITPLLANEKDITIAISELYDGVTHDKIEKIVDDIGDGQEINVIEDKKDSDVNRDELLKLTQEAPVVKITNMLVAEAVKLRASDVLIEPMENDVRIRYRVDGILVEGKHPPKRIHNAIISRLKVMADLNISERRLPQDGRFKIRVQNREIDFRLSILPSSMGEKAALRVLDKSQATLELEKLGFEDKMLDNLKKMADRPHGMILVCGPTGCGKTTTLYSVLKYIDSPDKNIITVEDPVEYQLYGINQVSVKPEIGLTFAGSLRSILRQDPDVIMIGEIRDFDTVDIAIKAALTGHLVLSTLHTTTAAGSIVRLVNMGVEPFLITSSILLVAAQRLVRRICPDCKEKVAMKPDIAKALEIDPKATLYKGRGCSKCQNTGYKGRIGVIETLVLTPVIRDLIVNRAQEHIINEAARKEGMENLRHDAIGKMLKGYTTLDEVIRVTVGEQDLEVH